MPEIKEGDLIEDDLKYNEEELPSKPPRRLPHIALNISDYKYLLGALLLEALFFYLYKMQSHRWAMIIVLALLWFLGLCILAAELFSESVIRKTLAFLILLSYLYIFFKLLIFVISSFA